MRKDAKTVDQVTIARVQGYHEQHTIGNYAFQGFGAKKYFNSDRYEILNDDYTRQNGAPLKGYGLEQETECTGITDTGIYAEMLEKVILSHFPADLYKLQRDGSLGGNSSAECITQVMTKAFIRNNYKNWKLMYDVYFPAIKISCVRTGNCGMHVNISNACFGGTKEAQEKAIKKLLYFVNHYYDLCCTLFSRNTNHTMYCRRMSQFSIKAACKNADLTQFGSNHGVCFNLGHYTEGRIELRLVGGQSTFACFRNTMETVFFLVDSMKSLTWEELDDMVAVFAGCNQYVYDRLTRADNEGTLSHDVVLALRDKVKREELI